MRKKIKKIAKWKDIKYNNYYYIAISKDRMPDWIDLNNKSNKAGWRWLHFEDVTVRRQLEAALYNTTFSYIFKVKIQKKYTKFWSYHIEHQKYRDVDFVGIAVNYKLQPATMHWKELIKQYNEERGSQHI
jgi:hypothetical protein